jgi:hypothetical protein
MTDSSKKYGTDEYTATPSHVLPAFGKNGKGYICQECGHLEVTLENSVFDDLCPKCVLAALKTLKVPHMVKISEYVREREALEPTVKVEVHPDTRPNSDKTTIILKRK